MAEAFAKKDKKWTLVVKPTTAWFDLHLQDVWRYRDLVMMFVRRDFISFNKQTLLGPLWFFIQPLLTTVMFMVVFTGIAKISTDQTPPALFYLSGLTVWNYFATCLMKTSGTFSSNSAIFGKVYFPRLASPISMIISSLLNFCIQFILFIGFVLYFACFKNVQIHLNAYVLLIPFLLIIMAGIAMGAGIIVSSLTVKYRDLSNLIASGLQLLMYASPIIYPLSSVKGKMRLLILANPMTSVIESFRYAFFQQGQFNWLHLEYSIAFMVVILLAGIVLFNKTEKNFIDII